MSSTSVQTTAGSVIADFVPGHRLKEILIVVGYALAIGVGAQLIVPLPFTPVPITGQTFVVLAGALLVGWKRASLGGILYLAAGLGGVPWFTPASSATLGYVIGFVPAAALVGWMAQRGFDRRVGTTLVAMAAGNLAIYAAGVPYLAAATGIEIQEAIALGAIPFVPGDVVKILFASVLLPGMWRGFDRH